MATSPLIRRALPAEFPVIERLRRSVVNEVYGRLWSSIRIEMDEEDWSKAWIASEGSQVVGVLLTANEWLDDLWILPTHRSRGLGADLLAHGETEIARRNHEIAHLRVVESNRRAVAFYAAHGWGVAKQFRHETLPVNMLELTKFVRADRQI